MDFSVFCECLLHVARTTFPQLPPVRALDALLAKCSISASGDLQLPAPPLGKNARNA